MKVKGLCSAALLALASASFAQTQSGSSIGAGPTVPPPSTGTSADSAGAAGTTSPRAADSESTSVGRSGATSGAASAGSTTGRCDTLIGEERQKCLKEQASTGTAGPGSTGMGSGAGGGTK